MTIRRAVAADAPAIGAIFDAAVKVAWTYMGEIVQEPMFGPEEWEDDVAQHAPPNAMLVAVDDRDEVVGFCAVHPGDGEMFLLFVHPAVAGRGVGRELLAAGHDALRAGGCTEAFLYTHEQNARAQAVYAAAGYRPDGTVRESDFRGIALREVRMVAPL
jgi:ribosomal protein S18 acetylase RimI-like enzyme